jgi:oligosaccharide repeat unit polymerase
MKYSDPWIPFDTIPAVDWAILIMSTLAFVIFYIFDYKKWGSLSFNSYFFGFNYFLKVVFLFPFAWSANNIIATGRNFDRIAGHLDLSFYLTLTGFVAMIVGIVAAKATVTGTPACCGFIYRSINFGWCNSAGAALSVLAVVALTGMLFALGFQAFVARSLVFERNDLRPFYNLWSQIVPLCAINIIVFGATRRLRLVLVIGILVALLGVIGGNRTVAILTLLQAGVILAMPVRFRRLSLMLMGILVLGTAAVSTSLLRDPSAKSGGTMGELFFGNELTDVRDFAWMLTGLDGRDWFWGKTYLAGYLSFIPAYLLPFREIYGFGRVSSGLAGLDPLHHGGLRPPIFGEMYVNFGPAGLVFGGLLYGLIIGRVMHWITNSLETSEIDAPITPQVVVWTGFLMLQIIDSFVFTPSFFGVYVLVGWLVTGQVLARLGRHFA